MARCEGHIYSHVHPPAQGRFLLLIREILCLVNMKSYNIITVAAVYIFAAGDLGMALPQAPNVCTPTPIVGPFWLTAVPSDGTSSYPIGLGGASRGVTILASTPEYKSQFTYNR